MVVSPDYSGRLIYEFKQKSADIIDRYNLSHLRGTEKLDSVTKIAAEFIDLAEKSSTNPTMTDSMLASEQRMYLQHIEMEVLKVSKNQAQTLNGLRAQAFGQAFVKDANWDKTVTSVAKEVDRIATKNSDLFNSLTPDEQKEMDAMFALVIDNVVAKQSSDPSAANAQKAERDSVRDLKQVEKRLNKMAKDSVKNRQTDLFNDTNEQLKRYLQSFTQLRKSMKPAEVKKAEGHIASIKTMMRELRTNRRLVTDRELLERHIAGIQNQFRMLNEIEGDVSETVSAMAGIFGSTGRRSNKRYFSMQGLGNMVSYDSIKDKHPERTNPAHIRSMQYFMNQGLS
ncbi:MAG: hypothetical protein CME55_00215, partial [Halieaceae bacterium]|nr:hypothetical protein [Halieaceae bacterium]